MLDFKSLYKALQNFCQGRFSIVGYGILQTVCGNANRYLATNTGSSISISSTYILFLTKMQKGQTPEKGFALFKNDITDFFPASELKIHCSKT